MKLTKPQKDQLLRIVAAHDETNEKGERLGLMKVTWHFCEPTEIGWHEAMDIFEKLTNFGIRKNFVDTFDTTVR